MTTFRYASDQSLMVYLGEEVNLETHHRVLKLLRLLESEPIPGVRNLHPAYHSILIVFDPDDQEHENIQRTVATYLEGLDSVELPEPRVVEIPVIYDGPDLDDVAALHQMTPQRVVELPGERCLAQLARPQFEANQSGEGALGRPPCLAAASRPGESHVSPPGPRGGTCGARLTARLT